MKTSTQIDFNYTQAKRQAEKLEEIADKLSKLSKNNMETSLRNIAASWKGENATKFLKKGDKLYSEMMSVSVDLKNIAKEMKTTAERVYKAEMEAARIAQTRTYNT